MNLNICYCYIVYIKLIIKLYLCHLKFFLIKSHYKRLQYLELLRRIWTRTVKCATLHTLVLLHNYKSLTTLYIPTFQSKEQREPTEELFPPLLFSFAFVLFKTCQAVFSFKWLKKDENSQFKRSFPFKSILDLYWLYSWRFSDPG